MAHVYTELLSEFSAALAELVSDCQALIRAHLTASGVSPSTELVAANRDVISSAINSFNTISNLYSASLEPHLLDIKKRVQKIEATEKAALEKLEGELGKAADLISQVYFDVNSNLSSRIRSIANDIRNSLQLASSPVLKDFTEVSGNLKVVEQDTVSRIKDIVTSLPRSTFESLDIAVQSALTEARSLAEQASKVGGIASLILPESVLTLFGLLGGSDSLSLIKSAIAATKELKDKSDIAITNAESSLAEKEQAIKAFLQALGYQGASLLACLPFIGLVIPEPFRDIYRAGWGEYLQKWTREYYRPSNLSPQEAAEALRRKEIGEGTFYDIAKYSGLSDEQLDILKRLTRRLLDVEQVRVFYQRGWITTEEAISRLEQLGYTRDDAEQMFLLFWIIPPISDLIHMMVRDVWNENVVREFGYDEDYPHEIEQYASWQGLSPDWARRYWRAHWVLPSPQQAYEMLHRNLIDERQLDTLLKIADYPKFWREKLIKISYTPFTRVDIRRMHKLGVLSDADLLRAYKDIGYDEWHASKLAEFTIKLNAEEEKESKKADRDLIKSEIVKLFKIKAINEADTKTLLIDLGYDDYEADFILEIAKYELWREEREVIIENTKLRYQRAMINYDEAVTILSSLNLSGTEIENYMLKWDTTKAPTPRFPSKAELDAFYRDGLLTIEEYAQTLMDMGFSMWWALKYSEQVVKKYGKAGK